MTDQMEIADRQARLVSEATGLRYFTDIYRDRVTFYREADVDGWLFGEDEFFEAANVAGCEVTYESLIGLGATGTAAYLVEQLGPATDESPC